MTAQATNTNSKIGPSEAEAFGVRVKGEGGKKAQGAAIKILFAATALILVGAFVYAFIIKPHQDEAKPVARKPKRSNQAPWMPAPAKPFGLRPLLTTACQHKARRIWRRAPRRPIPNHQQAAADPRPQHRVSPPWLKPRR